jgi:electron-transferring-flavoprotein dehydrogenase
LRVCLIEKGAEVGAHILSGAVIETRALDELLPDWRARGAPLRTEAREDRFVLLLGPRRSVRLPTPPQMRNKGNYIVSLGEVCRWLGKEAEAHGVEVYAGVAASELLMGARGEVQGVATGDLGLARDGKPKPTFQRGIELRARLTLLAEGARGSLTRVLDERLGLRAGAASSASYGLGVKELWEVPAERTSPGRVEHTIGWPLDAWTYGGSFIYHLERGLVAVGFVVGLDYRNPYLSPYREFQRFKTHPYVRGLLEGGRPLSYGARALYEGGIQALPRLTFPGGALIGDTAGFLNVPKIKGTHTAMKSGLLAAEAAFEALRSQPPERDGERPLEPRRYQELLRASWLWEELHRARNIRPYFAYGGLWGGLALSALDTYLLRGRAPWTLRMPEPDHKATLPLSDPRVRPISYPKPDGRLTFDLMTSVARSGTQHEEDQPPHLVLHDPTLPDRLNLPRFGGPEQYYCPAGPPWLLSFCRSSSSNNSSLTCDPRSVRVRSGRIQADRAALADQLHQLRALQDLRHQGPGPEHSVDHARGRRWSSLR